MVATLALVEISKNSDYPGLRVRIPPDLKIEWGVFCESKKINQQDAVLAMIRWLMSVDDIVQSMVLGQVKPAADLAQLVADRLARGSERARADIAGKIPTEPVIVEKLKRAAAGKVSRRTPDKPVGGNG